jgi:hypothetical protein
VVEALFVTTFLLHFSFLAVSWFNVLLGVGLISMVLVGVVSSRWSRKWHFAFGFIAVVSIVIWTLVLHITLIQNGYAIYGWLGICLSIIAGIGFIVLHKIFKNYGPSEILFIAITMLWNSMITLLVLSH